MTSSGPKAVHPGPFRQNERILLNVHFHVLVPNGAFDQHGVFVAADPPDDEYVR